MVLGLTVFDRFGFSRSESAALFPRVILPVNRPFGISILKCQEILRRGPRQNGRQILPPADFAGVNTPRIPVKPDFRWRCFGNRFTLAPVCEDSTCFDKNRQSVIFQKRRIHYIFPVPLEPLTAPIMIITAGRKINAPFPDIALNNGCNQERCAEKEFIFAMLTARILGKIKP